MKHVASCCFRDLGGFRVFNALEVQYDTALFLYVTLTGQNRQVSINYMVVHYECLSHIYRFSAYVRTVRITIP